MKIFLIDECNKAWNDKMNFYLYGGIVVDEKDVEKLSVGLIGIKSKYKIEEERPIKWNNGNWKGSNLSPEVHRNIKEDIINLFINTSSHIIVCLSPQKFYHKPVFKNGQIKYVIDPEKQKRTYKYGINDILINYEKYLSENRELGIVIADEFEQSYKNELTKYCKNILSEDRRKKIILPLLQEKNEDQPLLQINDVIIGSISFSLLEGSLNSIKDLKEKFWGYNGKPKSPLDKGFSIFPEIPRFQWCILAKDTLIEKFLRLISV